MKRILGISLAVLAVALLAVGTALWSGGSVTNDSSVASSVVVDSTSPGSNSENLAIVGQIAYIVRDSSGNIKENIVIPNTTVALFKNDARARLGVAGTTAPTSDDDLYDNISLCGADASGGLCGTFTAANVTENNPQDGTGSTGGEGVYSVVVTFNATGAVTIEELQLSKGSVTNGTAPSTSQIGAYQNVSITLANGDSIQITWTITVS